MDGNNKINPAEALVLSAEGIKSRLCRAASDFYDVKFVGLVDSTNTLAKKLAVEGCPAGMVIVADGQTAGRGRFGRAFHSPRGAGIYLSVVLRPVGERAKPELITTAAAVAVCMAAEALTGLSSEIKWVNDVLVGGKKVCGILTEGGASHTGGLDWAVVGIGVNLIPPERGFPSELRGIAGALYSAAPDADLPNHMTAAILDNFARLYVLPSDPAAQIAREYAARCSTPGKRVTVICGANRRQAQALRLDESLRLVVRYDDGIEEPLACGEVSVCPDVSVGGTGNEGTLGAI